MIRPLLTLCLVLFALAAVVSAVPVTGPVVITTPGTYELSGDITGAGENAGIEIRASGVVLEGNGHALLGNGARELPGILVQGSAGAPAEQVELRNLTVRGWQYGVRAIGASHILIDRVTARENTDNGLYLFSVTNSTVSNCTAEANGGSGVVLSDVSQDNVVENTAASGNEHNGLMLIASTANRLHGNTVRGNGAYGIDGYLARDNVIADNLFVNANNTHIEEFDRNAWSLPASAGPNIVGGPKRGGNFWGTPDGTGFSNVTPDANGDGFCDTPYTIATGNVDELPLKGTGGAGPTATPGFGAAGALLGLAALPFLRSRR
ncbi:MAG: NosD domain-containing protein [Methanospirillum sp.]